MTIIQLRYIVNIFKEGSFTKAAKASYVSQPTLSMQVSKLEEELGLEIFDRSAQPIVPTRTGVSVINQAQEILANVQMLHDTVDGIKNEIKGPLHIGIIPTIAPTLLHRILPSFTLAYPNIELTVEELQTEQIIEGLRSEQLDVGIASTPLREVGITERHLYYEPFVAFIPPGHRLEEDAFILQSDLDTNDLLLLQTGHCFRNNVVNLCGVPTAKSHLNIESGNFETLVRLSKKGMGMTLLPHLTAAQLKPDDKKLVRNFLQPVPTREVGMLVKRKQAKKVIIDALHQTILDRIPSFLREHTKGELTKPT